jgi:hypothetical protein
MMATPATVATLGRDGQDRRGATATGPLTGAAAAVTGAAVALAAVAAVASGYVVLAKEAEDIPGR